MKERLRGNSLNRKNHKNNLNVGTGSKDLFRRKGEKMGRPIGSKSKDDVRNNFLLSDKINFKAEKKQAIITARELFYTKDIIEAIQKATNLIQINDALRCGRAGL